MNRSEYNKRYYTANKDKIKAQSKEYCTNWYKENRERVLAKRKARYSANPTQELEKAKEYRNKVKHTDKYRRRVKNARLLRQYGITLEQFESMLSAQRNCCKLCLIDLTNSKIDVDHCHSSGSVRGLLCSNCNKALGLFKDSAEALRRAATYLEESMCETIAA
jgi:hypothetical protein